MVNFGPLIDLRFYVPHDAKWVISDTFFLACTLQSLISLVPKKLNPTQQSKEQRNRMGKYTNSKPKSKENLNL